MKALEILIMEDDRVIALDLLRIVNEAGFPNAEVVYDPFDALRIAQEKNIDILLSDIHLNHAISGIALAKRLQECCRIVSVFVTAYRDDETLRAVSNVEYADYILKPFRAEEIEAALKLAAMRIPARSSLPAPWHYEIGTRTLYHDGKIFPLSPKETLLFHLLFRAKGSVVPYASIEILLWPDGSINDNARRQLFYRFKKRLEGLPIVIEKGEGIALKSAA